MKQDPRLAIALMVHSEYKAVKSLVDYILQSGIPVVIHVDQNSPQLFEQLGSEYRKREQCSVISSVACFWGDWSLVEAEIACYRQVLKDFATVRYVSLISGSDLPVRPLEELQAFLGESEDDFVEAKDITRYDFVVSGPQIERFHLWWFISYLKHRYLFGAVYRLQKFFHVRRRIPLGMTPCMGGQFKTLKLETIKRIFRLLEEHPAVERYFRFTWIPDESFFPTLVNYLYEQETQTGELLDSLTYRKFNSFGRPLVFYEDNLSDIDRRGYWFARKFDADLVKEIERTTKTLFGLDEYDEKAESEVIPRPGERARLGEFAYKKCCCILVEPEVADQALMDSLASYMEKPFRFMGALDSDEFDSQVREMTTEMDAAAFTQWQYFKPLCPEDYVRNLNKYNETFSMFSLHRNSITLKKYRFLVNNPNSTFVFFKQNRAQSFEHARQWLVSRGVKVIEL